MRRIKKHTAEKLEYIRKYIAAYLVAAKTVPIKYYIDAFAGTGICILCNEKCKSKDCDESCNKGKQLDGSALIALKDKNHFARYFLCELSNKNILVLKDSITKKIDNKRLQKIEFIQGDSNIKIPEYINTFSGWSSSLVLLDPEGPEINWETIKSLSMLNRVDLLILYPYDMAFVRMTKEYKNKLDLVYGSSEWQQIYKESKTIDQRRAGLLGYYINNLKKLGLIYTEFKVIRTRYRSGKSLYHFILSSKKPIAVKIMRDIFNKPLDNQIRMKL